MKEYIKPKCDIITVLAMEALCLSFDSNDNTENWDIEEEETI